MVAGDDDGVNVDGDKDNKNVGDGAATVTNSVGIGLVEYTTHLQNIK